MVDTHGGVRKTHGDCVRVLQHNGTVEFTAEESSKKVELFNEDYPDICHDNTLLRVHNDKSIFVVKDGALHGFNSFRSFVARGYDTDNVNILESEIYIHAFTRGKNF